MARTNPYKDIPEGFQWPDTVDEVGEVDFGEYWIRSNNGETVNTLFGVLKGMIYRWVADDGHWMKSTRSLPEFQGHGGSTDYDRVSAEFATRLKAKWPSERPVRIEDV